MSISDIKAVILGTGDARRTVFAVHSNDMKKRSHCLWLFLAAACGSVMSNVKFQVRSGHLVLVVGLCRFIYLSQLLYARSTGQLSLSFISCGLLPAADKSDIFGKWVMNIKKMSNCERWSL